MSVGQVQGAFASLSLLVLLVAGLVSAAVSDGTCYYPDGNPGEPFLHSCGHPQDGHSACCHKDSYCMRNGLCWDGYLLYRSGCTDKTWADPSCPTTCRNFGAKNISQMISPWRVVPNTFCCGLLDLQNGKCLDSNGKEAPAGISIDSPFGIESFANDSYGNILPWLNMEGRHLPGSQPVNAGRGGDPAPAATTNTTPKTTAATPVSNPPPSLGSSSGSDSSDCPVMDASDSSKASDVGIGVGVSLGCCLVAAIIGNWWQWRRTVHMRAAPPYHRGIVGGVHSTWPQYDAPAYYAGAAGTPVKELRGTSRRAEMLGSAALPELPGSATSSTKGRPI